MCRGKHKYITYIAYRRVQSEACFRLYAIFFLPLRYYSGAEAFECISNIRILNAISEKTCLISYLVRTRLKCFISNKNIFSSNRLDGKIRRRHDKYTNKTQHAREHELYFIWFNYFDREKRPFKNNDIIRFNVFRIFFKKR